MCKTHVMTLSVAIVLLTAGCGKHPGPSGPSTAHQATETTANGQTDAQAGGPAEAVAEFLEAVRTGNDEAAARMLSAAARQKTAASNRKVRPPASDTAKFAIGRVDYVGHDGARVACTWTDLDQDGQPKTDEAVWVLRHETSGWRVAGVAAQVFPGEPPLLLNFEDPEEMDRKWEAYRVEHQRRMEKEEAGVQAQGGENSEKPIRR